MYRMFGFASMLTMLALSPAFGGMGGGRRLSMVQGVNAERANRFIDRLAERNPSLDLSSVRKAIGEAADGDSDTSPAGYVTHDELANILAGISMGVSIPVPIRSTTTAITAASTTLALTGTFREGNYFVAVAQYTGPSTVQVNQRSTVYGLTLTIDGQNIQGGQSIPPIPLSAQGAVAFSTPLDRPGTALAGTALGDFIANDSGHIFYAVFPNEESAKVYLEMLR